MLNHSVVRLEKSLNRVKTLFLDNVFPSEETMILGYDALRNRFGFRTPNSVTTIKDNKKIVKLTVKVSNEMTFETLVPVSSHVYGQSLGFPTTIPIASLRSMAINNIKVAMVDNFFIKNSESGAVNNEFSINYCQLMSVDEPTAIDFMNGFSDPPKQEKVKKRGRKKVEVKIVPKTIEEYLDSYQIVQVTSNDGTLFVCDGLILK